MINFSYTIWIPLLPLLMFLFLGLAVHKYFPKLSGIICTCGLAIITILSYITAYKYFFTSEKIDGAFQKLTAFNLSLIHISEPTRLGMISYAVFCLKKKKKKKK